MLKAKEPSLSAGSVATMRVSCLLFAVMTWPVDGHQPTARDGAAPMRWHEVLPGLPGRLRGAAVQGIDAVRQANEVLDRRW